MSPEAVLTPGIIEIHMTGREAVVYENNPPYAIKWRLGYAMCYENEALARANEAIAEIMSL